MSEQPIDPWNEGLRQDHPQIWARLERWLDEMAEITGNPRKPPEKYIQYNKPKNDDFLRKNRANHEAQKRATDERNRRILADIAEGRKTVRAVVVDLKMTTAESIRKTLISSRDRGAFDDMMEQFELVNSIIRAEMREEARRAREAEHARNIRHSTITLDGYTVL